MLRETIRRLLKEAIFQAPPATLEAVQAWVTEKYVGHVIAFLNEKVKSMGAIDSSEVDQLIDKEIARLKKYSVDKLYGLIDDLTSETRKRGFSIKLVPSHGQYRTIYVKADRAGGWTDSDAVLIAIMYGKEKPRPRDYDRWHAVGDDISYNDALRAVSEEVEKAIKAFEKKKGTSIPAPRGQQKSLEGLQAFRDELVSKYPRVKPKMYKSKASTTMPVDLSGWKYLDDSPETVAVINKMDIRRREKYLATRLKGITQKEIDSANQNFEWAKENLMGKLPNEVEDLEPPPEAEGYWSGRTYAQDYRYGNVPTEPYTYSPENYSFYGKYFEPVMKTNYKTFPGGSSHTPVRMSGIKNSLTKHYSPVESFDDVLKRIDLDSFKLTLNMKAHRSRSGQWHDEHGAMEIDVWQINPRDMDMFNSTLADLLETSRHECQHLGQTVLSRAKALGSDVAGMPSKKIIDPSYTRGGSKKSRMTGARREHALRDVEWHTRLADVVDDFMDRISTIEGDHIKYDNFRWFVTGRHRKADFFKQLLSAWKEYQAIADKRKGEKVKARDQKIADRYGLRYKRAVREFVKELVARGYTPTYVKDPDEE